jgi:hypothetical protein
MKNEKTEILLPYNKNTVKHNIRTASVYYVTLMRAEASEWALASTLPGEPDPKVGVDGTQYRNMKAS